MASRYSGHLSSVVIFFQGTLTERVSWNFLFVLVLPCGKSNQKQETSFVITSFTTHILNTVESVDTEEGTRKLTESSETVDGEVHSWSPSLIIAEVMYYYWFHVGLWYHYFDKWTHVMELQYFFIIFLGSYQKVSCQMYTQVAPLYNTIFVHDCT